MRLAAGGSLPPGRSLSETTVSTFGRDMAIVTTLFSYPGRPLIGRQSQTWVRFPDLGWKAISAHVSTMEGPKLW